MSRGDDLDFDTVATGIFTIAAGHIVADGSNVKMNWQQLAHHVIEATDAFMTEMQRGENGKKKHDGPGRRPTRRT